MQIFRRFFSKRPPQPADGPLPPPDPDEPIAVIGDIHGRADLLDKMLSDLDKTHPGAHKIFVGDYVDRGPDSRAVLDRLRNLTGAICLRGNHEEMLLDFLDRPAESARRWLRNGGDRTLASFGIALTDADVPEFFDAHQAFIDALADGTADWLRSLPLYWQSGNVIVTHAGPNPAVPVKNQPDSVFTWGHNRFLRQPRSDGIWVAHGHWIQDRPVFADSRISVDTGAVFSGRLSAAVIDPGGQVEFVTCRT